MIGIAAHGYMHVLTDSGVVISTKCSDLNTSGAIVLRGSDFQQKAADEMDLTGGDMEVITLMLNNLREIFPTDEERVPRSEKQKPSVAVVRESIA
jgi:hypothetical protein